MYFQKQNTDVLFVEGNLTVTGHVHIAMGNVRLCFEYGFKQCGEIV